MSPMLNLLILYSLIRVRCAEHGGISEEIDLYIISDQEMERIVLVDKCTMSLKKEAERFGKDGEKADLLANPKCYKTTIKKKDVVEGIELVFKFKGEFTLRTIVSFDAVSEKLHFEESKINIKKMEFYCRSLSDSNLDTEIIVSSKRIDLIQLVRSIEYLELFNFLSMITRILDLNLFNFQILETTVPECQEYEELKRLILILVVNLDISKTFLAGKYKRVFHGTLINIEEMDIYDTECTSKTGCKFDTTDGFILSYSPSQFEHDTRKITSILERLKKENSLNTYLPNVNILLINLKEISDKSNNFWKAYKKNYLKEIENQQTDKEQDLVIFDISSRSDEQFMNICDTFSWYLKLVCKSGYYKSLLLSNGSYRKLTRLSYPLTLASQIADELKYEMLNMRKYLMLSLAISNFFQTKLRSYFGNILNDEILKNLTLRHVEKDLRNIIFYFPKEDKCLDTDNYTMYIKECTECLVKIVDLIQMYGDKEITSILKSLLSDVGLTTKQEGV